jgi:hypothetical protein
VRVVGDQAAVFVAGVLAEATASLTAVALDPFVEVAQERDRRALLQLAAVAVGLALALDPPRLLVGASVALSLLSGAAEDAGVADRPALAVDALKDAGGLGLDEPPLVAAASNGLRGRRILGNAYELVPREPGAGRCRGAAPFDVADKTLTGGSGRSVGAASRLSGLRFAFAMRLAPHFALWLASQLASETRRLAPDRLAPANECLSPH